MADIKVITSTLLADHNTIQITDSIINNNTIFEVYVSDPDIVCNNIVVGGTTANITFDTKPEENTNVKIMLNNLNGSLSVNAVDVVSGTTNQDAINTSVSNSISALSSNKADTTTLNERVPSDTVVGGCLYHGTTGNEWKRLSGANVDYDSDTTINEKINSKQNQLIQGENITIENNVISASGSRVIYSNDECIIGTWLDKPLYRKVFNTNSFTVSNQSWTDVNAYISNPNIETFVNAFCNTSTGTVYQVYASIQNNHIMLLSTRNDNSLGGIVRVTLEYTKVGD